MTNEIKEVLAYFEEYIKITDMHNSEPMLNWKDLKIVLDYITNLQEENEKLKEIENFKFSLRKDETKALPTVTKNYKSEYEDYKSRCEKAIEKIESVRIFGLRSGKTLIATLLNDVLNILNGDDKSE